MALRDGTVHVGVSLFGIFIKSRFLAKLPFFSPRYAVSVERRRYRVSKDCDPFVGRPLRALAGHPVEAIISDDEVFALRAKEKELAHIILTCYLMPQIKVFTDDVLLNTRDIMTQTLVEEGVVDAQAANDFNDWVAQQ